MRFFLIVCSSIEFYAFILHFMREVYTFSIEFHEF